MQASEIRTKLSCDDVNILKQSLAFVTEKLSAERSRSARAETRATSILAVASILAGFVVHFSRLLGSPNQSNWLILFTIYVASILFLLKAALFAIKAHWSLKGYELTPDLAFDLQKLSESDALREEITWKIWEYYQLLPIGNARLLGASRAQRNIFAATITFAVLGTGWFFPSQTKLQVLPYVIIFLIVFLAVAVIFLDFIFERLGNLWHFR